MAAKKRRARATKRDTTDGYSPEPTETDLALERVEQLKAADPWREEIRLMIQQAEQRADDELHLDGYRNELTGIGMWERDKTFGGLSGGPAFVLHYLTSREVKDRWRGNDFGKKIVELLPDEMIRGGFDVVVTPSPEDEEPEDEEPEDEEPEDEPTEVEDAFPNQQPPQPQAGLIPPPPKPKPQPLPEIDDESQRIQEEVEGALEKLNWSQAFFVALCYERAFGGAAIYVGQEGENGDMITPLEEGAIQRITHLNVFAGGWDGEIIASSYYDDPLAPKYGEPRVYMLRNNGVPTGMLAPGEKFHPAEKRGGWNNTIRWVHESRFLLLPGMAVGRDARVEMRGWADGVFTRVDKILSDFDLTWSGIAIAMTEFNQTKLGISGLLAKEEGAKARGFVGKVLQRMQTVQMTKSSARAIIYDKENESADNLTVQLGGAAEVLDRFASRMAAACEMSKAELFGESPGGLSNGSEAVRFKYDGIKRRQERIMLSPLQKLVRLIFLSKQGPTKGVEPERWRINFRSLYQPSALEQAQERKVVADTDAVYIDKGVLTPEEVCASAFGGSKWTAERQVDFEGREAMAAQEEAEAAERAKAPPDPEEPKDKPPEVITIATPGKKPDPTE